MKRIIYLSVVAIFILVYCSKDDDIVPEPVPEPEPIEIVYTVNRENQYALNVVFFKPSDLTASSTLIDNVSKMMLYIQKWYEKQMELQGFGKKTFGLMTREGKVNVILISAPNPAASYSGHTEIIELVNKYFIDHPNEKKSEHTLVLGSKNSSVPFYGLGKWCFATSKGDFSLAQTGKSIDGLDLMTSDVLGGIMHELGHGINLPHNCQKESDLPNITLMSFGNHTYQTNPDLVYLTKASCALLNVSQTFNTTDKLFYSESPKVDIKSYSITKDNTKNATIIEGLITSDIKLTHFWVGQDGVPAGGGNNYDNITWSKPLLPTGKANEYSFQVEMAYSDIFNGYQAKDVLRLEMVVISENGMTNRVIDFQYTMNETTQVPNDDILKNYVEHLYSDRSKWTVTANSHAGSNLQANMIDGSNSTYWHSKWPWSIASDGNHVITIDMGETKDVNGVYLSSFRAGGQFRPKHVIVNTSDDKATWTEAKTFTIASIDDAREVSLNFDNVVNTRYIKITIDQVYMSSGTEENLIITELDIL